MTVMYYGQYKQRKLNEMILLGSHDAAITNGSANAVTQTKDILGQASDGARFFDLRVAAFKTSTLGGKVELRSYHDATKIESATFRRGDKMKVTDLGGVKRSDVKVHTTVLGVAGFGLQAMLSSAKEFLREGPTSNEFLMFKFDKSENWSLIYDTCMNELFRDGYLYETSDPRKRVLNNRTLEELKGKLLILFPEEAFAELPISATASGFLPWKNLYSKGARSAKQYSADYPGLQYYGKGGTSAGASGDTGKIEKNRLEQSELMQGKGEFKLKKSGWKEKLGINKPKSGRQDGTVNPDVVGLMYWTTTGASRRGISSRNNKMWKEDVQEQMINIALEHAPKAMFDMNAQGAAQMVKVFQPNIIMVDFVTHEKGMKVLSLNSQTATGIAEFLEQDL
jgi:hypothetical protein